MDRRHDGTGLDADGELSLFDVLLVLTRNRRLIGLTTLAIAVVGLLVAITSPSEYTSLARVVREANSESPSSLGSLAALRGFGINLGGMSTGLTADAYPDIAESREVRLAVVLDTFYFAELDSMMTYVDYVNRDKGMLEKVLSDIRQYTIGLSPTVKGPFQDTLSSADRSGNSRHFPTPREEMAIQAIGNVISTSVDSQTGLMTLRATTNDPMVSASIAASLLKHLIARVHTIQTEKARQNMQFMEERFEEAQRDLEKMELELAIFLDRNNNPQTATLRTELDRLKRKVSFKTQLYSDLQTQLTQAEIELQRSQPVVTVLEGPVPPTSPSGPRRTLTVFFSLFLGGIVGTALAVVKTVINKKSEIPAEREKLEEVRAAFGSHRFLDRFFGKNAASNRGEPAISMSRSVAHESHYEES